MAEQQRPFPLHDGEKPAERAKTLMTAAKDDLIAIENALDPLWAEPGENAYPDLPPEYPDFQTAKNAVRRLLESARELQTFVAWLEGQDVEQTMHGLLAKLPEISLTSYEIAHNITTDTYSLILFPHTMAFQDVSGQEAIERTRRFVAEREGYPTLPVDAIESIDD